MSQISTVIDELKDDIIHQPIHNGRPASESARKSVAAESKVYIQQNSSFIESTPDKLRDTKLGSINSIVTSRDLLSDNREFGTIDMAILFQRKSHIVSNLCYGLLGGISLMQLVLTYTLVKGSKNEIISFIELYSKFGFVPSASFTILTTICLVFALDRIDLLIFKKQVQCSRRVILNNCIVLLLYLSMFILSALCYKFDEVIALYPESKKELSVSEDLWLWKTFNLWKCVFGIIGWFIICITKPHDSLHHHLSALKNMSLEKNQNSN